MRSHRAVDEGGSPVARGVCLLWWTTWIVCAACGGDASLEPELRRDEDAPIREPESSGPRKPGPGEGYDFSEVDDECGLDTGYPGDVLCLRPPAPEEGFQLHVGPADYQDPLEVEKFLLAPQTENVECMFVRTPNDKLVTYYEREIHMRPISHHLFAFLMAEGSVSPDKIDAGWVDCGGFFEGRTGSIGGAETPIVQYPPHGVTAPENEGLGRTLNRRSLVRLEMHSFNFTDKPVLREAWLNVYYRPRDEIQQWVADVNMLGGFNIATPPGAREVMKLKHRMTNSARLLNLYGHGHSHMVRFSAWLDRGGERTLLLEDFDWQHPTVLLFDSLTQNTTPERSQLRAGGYTGMVNLEAGDVLEWECEVENTTDVTLRYRNEVETGEMCNIFGEYVGNGGGLGNQALSGEVTTLE